MAPAAAGSPGQRAASAAFKVKPPPHRPFEALPRPTGSASAQVRDHINTSFGWWKITPFDYKSEHHGQDYSL